MGVLLSLGALLFFTGDAAAQALATTARQLPKGSLKLLAYYQGTKDQVLNFNLASVGSCATGGAVPFACGQGGGDVEGKGSGGMGVMKAVYQPWESFQYYALFGAGDYALRVPFNNTTTTLSGDNPGIMWGAGLKAVILPDTDVSPAVSVDLGLSQSRYKFNRRHPTVGATSANINQALTLNQYQVALVVSHLFVLKDAVDKREAADMAKNGFAPLSLNGVKLEPYGGVKWVRIQADLHDLQDGSHAGGRQDTISPMAGLRIPVYEREALFAEASFVNGTQYAAGLEIRFK